jgi:hypothetical protein
LRIQQQLTPHNGNLQRFLLGDGHIRTRARRDSFDTEEERASDHFCTDMHRNLQERRNTGSAGARARRQQPGALLRAVKRNAPAGAGGLHLHTRVSRHEQKQNGRLRIQQQHRYV